MTNIIEETCTCSGHITSKSQNNHALNETVQGLND